jgi:hypothetical protein
MRERVTHRERPVYEAHTGLFEGIECSLRRPLKQLPEPQAVEPAAIDSEGGGQPYVRPAPAFHHDPEIVPAAARGGLGRVVISPAGEIGEIAVISDAFQNGGPHGTSIQPIQELLLLRQ